jgi:hypothetical protein
MAATAGLGARSVPRRGAPRRARRRRDARGTASSGDGGRRGTTRDGRRRRRGQAASRRAGSVSVCVGRSAAEVKSRGRAPAAGTAPSREPRDDTLPAVGDGAGGGHRTDAASERRVAAHAVSVEASARAAGRIHGPSRRGEVRRAARRENDRRSAGQRRGGGRPIGLGNPATSATTETPESGLRGQPDVATVTVAS